MFCGRGCTPQFTLSDGKFKGEKEGSKWGHLARWVRLLLARVRVCPYICTDIFPLNPEEGNVVASMSWSERVGDYRTLLSGGVSMQDNMLAVIATTSLVVLGLTWLILDFPRVSIFGLSPPKKYRYTTCHYLICLTMFCFQTPASKNILTLPSPFLPAPLPKNNQDGHLETVVMVPRASQRTQLGRGVPAARADADDSPRFCAGGMGPPREAGGYILV